MSPPWMQLIASLASLVITAMPSLPMRSSTNSTPLDSHASICSSLILEDASLMSVSPLQNNSKPSPVPGPSTVTLTSGLDPANFSDTSIEMGSTVEEPEMTTDPEPDSEPLSLPESSPLSSLLQAPSRSAPAIGTAAIFSAEYLASRPVGKSFKGTLLGPTLARAAEIPPHATQATDAPWRGTGRAMNRG